MYVFLKSKDQPTPIKKCRWLSSLIVTLYVRIKTFVMQATLEDGQQILHIIDFVQNVLNAFIAIFCLYGKKFTNCGKL